MCENPPMRRIRLSLFVLMIVCGNAWALDPFEGTQCGADIPRALAGKHDSNEPVAALEGRHKNLGLKDLGATEISDRLVLVSWQICGSEYELLVNTKTQMIRDVLPFPAHSKTSPQFVGRCQVDGTPIRESVVAVLNNSAGYDARDQKQAKTMLNATAAWKIDETREKFAMQPMQDLACPLVGIATVDGGP